MRITVKTFASLREVMENEVHMVVREGETLGQILSTLCETHAGLGEALFETPGILRQYVNILKNGRNIAFIGGTATTVEEGDVIAIFPPVAGG